MHRYRCASCGERFETEGYASKCPKCRGKILIHEEGQPRRKKCCGGASCAGCSGGCSCGH